MTDKNLLLTLFGPEALNRYLAQAGTEGLSLALVGLRSRRRNWSIETFVRQADLSVELWEGWEEGTSTPSAEQLDKVLQKLYWLRWKNDDLEGGKPDSELWEAFDRDHWDDDEAISCCYTMPRLTPEHKLEMEDHKLKTYGITDPVQSRQRIKAFLQRESVVRGPTFDSKQSWLRA